MNDQDSADVKGLRLVAHPLRLRLLSLLTGRTMSAAAAARELGETQANVSYHIRRLAEGGLLELVDEVAIRGGIAKRYTHNSDSGEALTDSDRESFLGLMQALAYQLTARAPLYRENTTFAFTDAHVSIPAEEWPRVQGLARELGRVIHELAERPAGDRAVSASLTVAAFETA
ncbi:winged helix-turn-helix domain-containing protein [Rathayibacter tanaceti]|uniref:Helix-turn-helix domain protein n=2 Tax=Rathayibacter tanaceti TaxID=1671680 RepID=A0A168G7C2_9MICO|nr:helix-turn-helix domain-containing protein [Rathayibacter tanaceti]KZX21836.1 Helix-turn-helix domain protein [Rathayibacter tanaceti]QHC56743.1 helix-turn-helix domain-containing protein [Rathayibacter tanaceti]TCO32963.1 helix-turn-helix protein [Rathayibacter tanaceti]